MSDLDQIVTAPRKDIAMPTCPYCGPTYALTPHGSDRTLVCLQCRAQWGPEGDLWNYPQQAEVAEIGCTCRALIRVPVVGENLDLSAWAVHRSEWHAVSS